MNVRLWQFPRGGEHFSPGGQSPPGHPPVNKHCPEAIFTLPAEDLAGFSRSDNLHTRPFRYGLGENRSGRGETGPSHNGTDINLKNIRYAKYRSSDKKFYHFVSLIPPPATAILYIFTYIEYSWYYFHVNNGRQTWRGKARAFPRRYCSRIRIHVITRKGFFFLVTFLFFPFSARLRRRYYIDAVDRLSLSRFRDATRVRTSHGPYPVAWIDRRGRDRLSNNNSDIILLLSFWKRNWDYTTR